MKSLELRDAKVTVRIGSRENNFSNGVIGGVTVTITIELIFEAKQLRA